MSDAPRIVIRRKRREHPAHHGGAWKIAYADYVTAMMAFFLVMWLVALIPRESLGEMAEYFRMPLMDAIRGGEQINDSSSVIPGQSPSVIPNKNPLPARPANQESDRRDTQRLQDLKARLEELIDTDPVLRQFRPQLLLDMTPEGLRIQIVDQQNRPMFQVGSAVVQPYMRIILRELGPLFNHISNSVTISGHTDAQQYARGERSYSNWELSADRANAARQELVAGGMEEGKVKRILGLASTVNLIKDDPNAAVNRRISLVVLNQRTERRIDQENATGSISVDAQGNVAGAVESSMGAMGAEQSAESESLESKQTR
ncbi:MAG TPA: motility protein MotB [Pusillimonas sp.]|jgi:chemotaxis protein MotB|nr:motility protein MotB [Pusillimonas sp.]MBC41944.1 motility protein MotB [Pusillimonas sp.]HBT33327.1 motility protein MotB [Pusillimonas sp.]HCN70234.1 motility protein MotB [Pusillimonas sp.]HCP78550.1 motility protein MotB [Pusillimonas sp.]|tara:strand:+ start:194735 stop:195682 length:948 start_codon:yes stop_codon:yes gene_type:complete